jgi:hypothetical protein
MAAVLLGAFWLCPDAGAGPIPRPYVYYLGSILDTGGEGNLICYWNIESMTDRTDLLKLDVFDQDADEWRPAWIHPEGEKRAYSRVFDGADLNKKHTTIFRYEIARNGVWGKSLLSDENYVYSFCQFHFGGENASHYLFKQW